MDYKIDVNNAMAHTDAIAAGVAGRKLTHAERIQSATATAASLAAHMVTQTDRQFETQAAVKAVLASQEGRQIVSDIVYDGVVKALNDRAPSLHNPRY